MRSKPKFLLDDKSVALSLELYIKENGWKDFLKDVLTEKKESVLKVAANHPDFDQAKLDYQRILTTTDISIATKLMLLEKASDDHWKQHGLLETIFSQEKIGLLEDLKNEHGDYGFLPTRVLHHLLELSHDHVSIHPEDLLNGLTMSQKKAKNAAGEPICYSAMRLKRFQWLAALLQDEDILNDESHANFQDDNDKRFGIFHWGVVNDCEKNGNVSFESLLRLKHSWTSFPADKEGNDPVMLAIQRQKQSTVRSLLNLGPVLNLESQNDVGNTALHLAFKHFSKSETWIGIVNEVVNKSKDGEAIRYLVHIISKY